MADLPLNWAHIRSFLAVAQSGSLSAAARETGISQPTLGRHLKAAESALGVTLFVRELRGLRLTESGRALLEPAREMAAASHRLQARAAGRDNRLSGTVRVTASVVVSHCLLPPIIAGLREREPAIEIELLPSDTIENLSFRDADIAIRMFRPTQLDIVTRHLADHPLALYAARSLIAQRGEPEDFAALGNWPFVGFDRSDLILRAMRGIGFAVDRHFFGVRCDDQAAWWQLVCAGCGIGAMQTVIGDAEARVQRLALQPELPALPLWLAAHGDRYQNARVRRVWDYLVSCLASPSAGSSAVGLCPSDDSRSKLDGQLPVVNSP